MKQLFEVKRKTVGAPGTHHLLEFALPCSQPASPAWSGCSRSPKARGYTKTDGLRNPALAEK
jgi:hypothetical protein